MPTFGGWMSHRHLWRPSQPCSGEMRSAEQQGHFLRWAMARLVWRHCQQRSGAAAAPPFEFPWSLKCNSCRSADVFGVMWVCFRLARGGQQNSPSCKSMANFATAAAETLQPLRSASFSGGTCISGHTVLEAAQQEGVQQCLKPLLTACGSAAAASTAPAEGPAVPQAGQSLPDIHRQVDALVAQDGEQSTDQSLCSNPAGLACMWCVLCDQLHQPGWAHNHLLMQFAAASCPWQMALQRDWVLGRQGMQTDTISPDMAPKDWSVTCIGGSAIRRGPCIEQEAHTDLC